MRRRKANFRVRTPDDRHSQSLKLIFFTKCDARHSSFGRRAISHRGNTKEGTMSSEINPRDDILEKIGRTVASAFCGRGRLNPRHTLPSAGHCDGHRRLELTSMSCKLRGEALRRHESLWPVTLPSAAG